MKPRLLIISEDTVKIQSYSGRLGRLFSRLYLALLRCRIFLLVKFFHRCQQITLLSSDCFSFPQVKQLFYSQEIIAQDFSQANPLAWQLTREISQRLIKLKPVIKLWELKLAYSLSYNYLVYFNYYQRLIKQEQPDQVIVFGQSPQARMALYQARQQSVKTRTFCLLGLSLINQRLGYFFRKREYRKMEQRFVSQAGLPRPAIPRQPRPVLLSADFFRHLKTLVPIYSYLKQKNLNPWFITSIVEIKVNLANFNLTKPNFSYLASFLPKNFYQQHCRQWQKQADQLCRQARPEPKNFLLNLFFPELESLIKHGLIVSRLYLEAGERLFQQLKPRAVVVIADARMIERSLALLARKHRVPSILTSSHTIVFDEEPNRLDTTDKISVAGQQAYQKLVQLGINPQKIKVCGDPRYELPRQHFSKAKVFQQLGIKNLQQKIVLLISDRPNTLLPEEEKQQSFLMASQAVKQIKEAVLVIKPHPTERRYCLLEELKQWGINQVIVSNNDQLELFALLQACSLVLLNWSMTGLEAILFNRPIIVINPTAKDYNQIIPYVSGQAAALAKNKAQLVKQLKILLNKQHPQTKKQLQQARKFAQFYIKKPDGYVCQRICQFLFSSS